MAYPYTDRDGYSVTGLCILREPLSYTQVIVNQHFGNYNLIVVFTNYIDFHHIFFK